MDRINHVINWVQNIFRLSDSDIQCGLARTSAQEAAAHSARAQQQGLLVNAYACGNMSCGMERTDAQARAADLAQSQRIGLILNAYACRDLRLGVFWSGR